MSTQPKSSRTAPRLRRMGWMSLALSVVVYLAGSNIGSGWIVMLAAALFTAPLLDLFTAWSVHRRTTVDARFSGPPKVGAGRLVLSVRRPQGMTALRVSAGSANTRGVTRRPIAEIQGPLGLSRGAHRDFNVKTETVGPLGLAFARSIWSYEIDLVIGPATVACPARVKRVVGGIDDDERRRRTRRDDEIQGVRPFVHGDPQRLVNWRATARHGEMMVREHARAGGGADLNLHVTAGLWDVTTLDLACTVISSIAEQADAQGHRVNVHLDGGANRWDRDLLNALALLPPAHGVVARPLNRPPAHSGPCDVVVGTRENYLHVGTRGSEPAVLADAAEVVAWLRA